MKVMPAPAKARSNRGDLALPPEAKISTRHEGEDGPEGGKHQGPFTEVRSFARFPWLLVCQIFPPCGRMPDRPAVCIACPEGVPPPEQFLRRVERSCF